MPEHLYLLKSSPRHSYTNMALRFGGHENPRRRDAPFALTLVLRCTTNGVDFRRVVCTLPRSLFHVRKWDANPEQPRIWFPAK